VFLEKRKGIAGYWLPVFEMTTRNDFKEIGIAKMIGSIL
jgi:hypothetical protein